jgi:hypothetical protein
VTPEVASLLLRQHAALMEEGVGPEAKRPEDDDTLNEAWLLVRTFSVAPQRFTRHWGYEYGFVDKDDHDATCTCWGARCSRGEVAQCGVCDRFLHDDIPHRCGPSRTSWFVS